MLLAWGLAALFGVIVAAFSIARIESFRAGQVDLDIHGQAIWNTAHGRPFASTVLKRNENRLAEHLPFSLVPLAPLYALAPDMRVLVALQALLLGAASLPIYLYARRQLDGYWTPLLIQAAFLGAPLTAVSAFEDFQPVLLTILPLAAGAYLLSSGRSLPGGVLLALAVLMEEEAALVVIGIGALLAVRQRKRLGGVLVLGATVYLALATQVIMPAFQAEVERETVGNRSLTYFDDMLADPGLLVDRLHPALLLDVLIWHLAPSGGLALVNPVSLLPAVPTFLALILEDEEMGESRYREHWAAVMLPFMFFGAADGIRRLRRARIPAAVLVSAVVLGSTLSYVWQSPLPGGGLYRANDYADDADDVATMAEFVDRVPAAIPLAASSPLVAYLNHRREIYVFPPERHYAEGVGRGAARVRSLVLHLEEGDTERVLGDDPDRWIVRYGARVLYAPSDQILFLTDDFPAPSRLVADALLFDDAIRLDGFDADGSEGRVVLTLHWSMQDLVYSDLEREVELIADDGTVVAATTALPLLQILPTTRWQRGQRIVDRVVLAPATPQEPGAPYRFRVEWRATPGGTASGMDQAATPTYVSAPFTVQPRPGL